AVRASVVELKNGVGLVGSPLGAPELVAADTAERHLRSSDRNVHGGPAVPSGGVVVVLVVLVLQVNDHFRILRIDSVGTTGRVTVRNDADEVFSYRRRQVSTERGFARPSFLRAERIGGSAPHGSE